jgi:hypothetical protein
VRRAGGGNLTGMENSERRPAKLARNVGLGTIGVILIVLAIFLVITVIEGDRTNDLGPSQPHPSPASSS